MKNTLLIVLLIISNTIYTQTVGVVLSGGGASGMAHVGMLKALEENNIPIDYIVGTSAGALVASLYANGYSPNEIDSILISQDFLLMAEGKLREKDQFYFKKSKTDASIVNLTFDKNISKESFIPSNYVYPNFLDFKFLELYQNYNNHIVFDSLFIPFRCVSADVSNNKAHVFRNGNINEAVRTSMTYPFYMKPIKVDGRYMYDGGIYNNFPSDVLYKDFLPDVIIGCNLSDTTSYNEEDFVSQLTNIILNRANNDVTCENGIVIKPKTTVGTFDFKNSYQAMLDGYNETILKMDSIKSLIPKLSNNSELTQKRKQFRINNNPTKYIDSISVSKNITEKQKEFITKSLIKKGEIISINDISKRFFRLVEDQNILHIFPRLIKNQNTNNYILTLETSLQKDFELEFGGIFSSSPINTGFVGLNYKRLQKTSSQLELNSYFGKLYGSVFGTYNIELPHYKIPFKISPFAGINRYDYFKSYATFFEDVKPSYIVQSEYYSGLKLTLPIKNHSTISSKYSNFYSANNYYQTKDFTNADTTDFLTFYGNKYELILSHNTLNEKAFPIKGNKLETNIYYLKGLEDNRPGSTSFEERREINYKEWSKLKLTFDGYKSFSKNITLGFFVETVLSTEYNFSNYFSTLLFSNQFLGINQLNTIFSEKLRSNNYVSFGIKPIIILKENIQIRNELYAYSSIFSIRQNQSNQATILNQLFLTQYFIGKTSFTYTSPFGPLSLSLIYLQPEENPFQLQFNFGYIIHNKRIFQ